MASRAIQIALGIFITLCMVTAFYSPDGTDAEVSAVLVENDWLQEFETSLARPEPWLGVAFRASAPTVQRPAPETAAVSQFDAAFEDAVYRRSAAGPTEVPYRRSSETR